MNTINHFPSSNDEIHWLLTSPALFAQLSDVPLMPPEARSRIAQALHSFLSSAEHAGLSEYRGTVGHRAEMLLAHALAHCPGIELIAQQKTLRVHAQTIGELDVLYDDHARQRRVHCELSVRMLLQRHPQTDGSAWCGSDPRHPFSEKWQRMRDHQIPLGQHPDVPRHPTWPTVSEALILGWALQPLNQPWPDLLGAAPDHLRGWWVRHGEQDVHAPHEPRDLSLSRQIAGLHSLHYPTRQRCLPLVNYRPTYVIIFRTMKTRSSSPKSCAMPTAIGKNSRAAPWCISAGRKCQKIAHQESCDLSSRRPVSFDESTTVETWVGR